MRGKTASHGDNEPKFESDHKLRVYSDITELIASVDNPTPLVKIRKMNPSKDFHIFLKLERFNPFGSVKDRIAIEMIRNLDIGDKTVIEPSSGNTGIALACICNALGVPLEIAVPERIPEEKKVLLRLLGVKLREAEDSLCPLYPHEGARGLVDALLKSRATKEKYVSPNQYENQCNVLAHYRTTGPEVWKQTKGNIDYFFAGFGTCGTLMGVGKYLKERNNKIKIIGVEPTSPEHKLPGMKRISDLGEEFVPKILDKSLVDEVVVVSDKQAYETAIRLARLEGIPAGPTTGAILHAALRHGEAHTGLAVVISPDDAFKYASFFKEFLTPETAEVAEKRYDLSDLVCPLSRIRATELIDRSQKGDVLAIELGDIESVKNLSAELKERGFKPEIRQTDDERFLVRIRI